VAHHRSIRLTVGAPKQGVEQRNGKGKINRARCRLFAVHRLKDRKAVKDVIQDDERAKGDQAELPDVEQGQDAPHPHARANVDQHLPCVMGRLSS